MLALLAAALGCGDPARDQAYRGEALFVVEGRFAETPWSPPFDADEPIVMDLVWDGARAGDAARIAGPADARVEVVPPSRFRVTVLRPPAPREHGDERLALGQLVAFADRDGDRVRDLAEPTVAASDFLVAFAPDGTRELAPGFHLVSTFAPCDVDDDVIIAAEGEPVLYLSLDRPTPVPRYAPDCRARAAQWWDPLGCPDLTTVRWVCRFGGGASFCAECAIQLFPLGADAATCERWRARCDARLLDDCALEERLCLVGEPPGADACDLPCACAAFHERCLETTPREVCDAKVVGCDWR